MIFTETKLKGAFTIDLERREDLRGFFARAFCQHEFEAHGLKSVIAQANIAHNISKGTVRGMHFQYPPAAETKLVRCTRGAIFDIIVDLRPESPTYLDHVAVELNADNQRALSMSLRDLLTGTKVYLTTPIRAIRSGNSIRRTPKLDYCTTTGGWR